MVLLLLLRGGGMLHAICGRVGVVRKRRMVRGMGEKRVVVDVLGRREHWGWRRGRRVVGV